MTTPSQQRDRAGWRAVVPRVWSKAARARRDRQTGVEDHEAGRLAWVREHAPGKSFADIGGLFRYMGDIAFLAEESGATSVTLFDVGDPDVIAASHPEWGTFADKRRDRGSQVRYVQGDLEEPSSPARIGVHDVVFCSGVLYHTPNPMQQLLRLREITGEQLFLSTLTIPEVPGFPNATVFYPYLPDELRQAIAAGYDWADSLLGIGTPIDERPMYGYGNCWWGITRSALRSMLRAARFEVVHERVLARSPFLTELVARPVDLAPLLPPAAYFRERGEAIERGEERPAFDGYYDRS